jgi:hypothetical protein
VSATDVGARLEEVRDRLESRGFRVTDEVTFEGTSFRRVAHKSGFELKKFGNVETFFVFAEFATLKPSTIQKFSESAFRFAMASKRSLLPCGLLEAVICFAVAIVERLDEPTAEAIRTTEPRNHWAAFEMPVAYDRSTDTVCHYEMTPAWGAWYYPTFRKQIAELFGAGAKAP